MASTLSRFQVDVRNAILQQLEMGPANIAEIMNASGFKYHSIRQQMRLLEDEGTIRPIDRSYRNARFTFAGDNGPNNIIPVIRSGSSNRFKLQELLELRHTTEPAAVKAVHNLPKHVARIFKAAIRLHEGRDVAMTLAVLRNDVERDLESLKKMVDVYEQVLNDGRNWNPESLARYPNDATFDSVNAENAYKHYFKDVTNNDS